MPVRTCSAKPSLRARFSNWPMGSAISSYRPAWSVVVVRETPVSRLFAVTVAPDTTAPVWSVTRPDTLAETWASAAGEHSHTRHNSANWSQYLADIVSLQMESRLDRGTGTPHGSIWTHKDSFDLIE